MKGWEIMATVATSISLPKDVVEQIEVAAAELDRPVEVVVRAAVGRYLKQEREWRELQARGAELARAGDIYTEDDVEEFLDSLPD